MKVLITGGAGYVGYALAIKLAAMPEIEEIILYDNLSRHNEIIFFGAPFGGGKIRLIKADILDARKLKKAMQGVDICYHLAAKVLTPFANQDPHFFEQINHWGTSEVVEAVENAQVKHFIYLSSTSVYDRVKEEATESTIPNPHTYYGISKLRGEEHVKRIPDATTSVIVRSGNIYGHSPSMRFDAVINNFMFQANFENTISIHGTGAQTRAFIHIDHAVDTLARIPFSGLPSGTYNMVAKNLAVNDIAEAICSIYPTCDRIFINQHLLLGSIQVSTDSKMWDYIQYQQKTLHAELAEFKDKFAFTGKQG